MEVTGALIVAQELLTTTAQAGFAAYQISKPTLPLKCHFHRFASGELADVAPSLARCNHSLTVMHGKAYIFGGRQRSQGELCSNDMHIISLPNFKHSPGPEYQCVPALPVIEGKSIPPPRHSHKTKANGDDLEIYGGTDASGKSIDEDERWSFNTNTLRWSLKSGTTSTTSLVQASSSANEAVQAGDYYYFVNHPDGFSSTINYRKLDSQDWQTHTIPTNPLSPGPAIRKGASTIPITTGHGRNYLIFLFDAENPDIWALQLHSSDSSYAKSKDLIREGVDVKSGLFEWEPVEIQAPEVEEGVEGKSLPGPMADYAVDRVLGNELLSWGGVDARALVSGEGWTIRFE